MTIAWRRLADVPRDDPRPWLYATARNLLLAERRRSRTARLHDDKPAPEPAPELFELDPELASALRELSPLDREALLLTAWEELTPKEAARALGIKPTAFRVRLLRARRRVEAKLEAGDILPGDREVVHGPQTCGRRAAATGWCGSRSGAAPSRGQSVIARCDAGHHEPAVGASRRARKRREDDADDRLWQKHDLYAIRATPLGIGDCPFDARRRHQLKRDVHARSLFSSSQRDG